MNTDIRIKTTFLTHHKTIRLRRKLGPEGVLSLIALWLYVAQYRPDGDISDLAPEDVAAVSMWEKDPYHFFGTLIEVGFVDECLNSDGSVARKIHDWGDHNAFAARGRERAINAKINALKRWGKFNEAELLRHEDPEVRKLAAQKLAHRRWHDQKGACAPPESPVGDNACPTHTPTHTPNKENACSIAWGNACPESLDISQSNANGIASGNAPNPIPIPIPNPIPIPDNNNTSSNHGNSFSNNSGIIFSDFSYEKSLSSKLDSILNPEIILHTDPFPKKGETPLLSEQKISPGKKQEGHEQYAEKFQSVPVDTGNVTVVDVEPPDRVRQAQDEHNSTTLHKNPIFNNADEGRKQPRDDIEPAITSKKDGIPYSEIIAYLNKKTGKNFRDSTPETRKLIRARWRSGFRLEDFKKVIDNMTAKWLHDPKMRDYLRPVTLFGTKFESYLNSEPSMSDLGLVSSKMEKGMAVMKSWLEKMKKKDEMAKKAGSEEGAIGTIFA